MASTGADRPIRQTVNDRRHVRDPRSDVRLFGQRHPNAIKTLFDLVNRNDMERTKFTASVWSHRSAREVELAEARRRSRNGLGALRRRIVVGEQVSRPGPLLRLLPRRQTLVASSCRRTFG
ncbi:MAG: hypothetical protein ACOVQ0_01480 [Novosphingobium sp.]|jgi:hypothetical protein|uniref:hypothetical protein n=1 Tax=Novosphingobium sp. TaxID=1874826 RepID=UPI003B992CA6